MKNILFSALRIILAIFMIYGGAKHFTDSNFYNPFVPDFFGNKHLWIISSGVVEILLGAGLLFGGEIGKFSALGILLLMFAFLPIHIYDVFADKPAIGSHKLALVRLPFQFLFIAWSWFVYSKTGITK